MKRTHGILGWIAVIAGGLLTAVGGAFLTLDTSEKVLGKFVDDTNEEIKKLEMENLEGDDEEEES